MKNAIPLVIAVILGLAAVFAVSRTLAKQSGNAHGKDVAVLVANGNLKSGGVIAVEHFRAAQVPLAYLPKQHILADQKTSVVGQTLVRDIAAGDYIQWNDIGQTSGLGESVGEGEWAVSASFKNVDLVKLLKPGDEIAVFGRFPVKEVRETGSSDVQQAKVTERKMVMTVLFPQVRIMGTTGRSGAVLLSLPPQQALTLAEAERSGDLYAALRRPHDDKMTNRKDCGLFCGEEAFGRMGDGCKKIAILDQPFNKVK